jgi:NADPH:quinone reductase-like Zn-dependent oxidoreductase
VKALVSDRYGPPNALELRDIDKPAVQIAKAFGARVTGVCSTRNLDLVLSIGADDVIDYTEEDFAAGEERYDLLLDNVGNRSLSDYRKVLTQDGMYLASFGQPENKWLGPLWKLARMFAVSKFVGQRMVLLNQHRKQDDLGIIRELIEAGTVTPVIDETFPLEQAAEAMNYLEAGRTRGKTVITV